MKKKKFILIGLSLLLLVLIFFTIKNFTYNYYYINSNGERKSFDRSVVKRNFDCEDGTGEVYYVKDSYYNNNAEKIYSTNKVKKYVAKIKYSGCENVSYYYIKNHRNVEVVYKEMYENEEEYYKAEEAADQRFKKYLDNKNNECNDCLITLYTSWPGGFQAENYITNKKNNKNKLDNSDLKTFYYTDDFKIYTIDQNGEKVFGYNEKLKRDLNCYGSPFIQYYIKETIFKDNVKNIKKSYHFNENSNDFDFLKNKSIAQKSSDKCNDENYFITKEEDNIIVAKNLYKNKQEYENALKKANENFDKYLKDINTKCDDCILEMDNRDVNVLYGPYRYSTGKSLFKESEICTSDLKTLDIGRTMYPISDEYKTSKCKGEGISCINSDNVLGVLFTADDCGEDRIKEIYGDDNYFPYGLKIKLNDTDGLMYIIETLKNIGFECSYKNENNCLEWILNKQVKIEDLLQLKTFYNWDQFSMDNVYLEHIDYTDNYLEIGLNQSLYVSQDLDLKFIYADYDPYSEERCVITEEENKISNSCGFFIEVIEKDAETNPYDTVLSLIPDPNYCNIKTFDDAITNFDWAYKITPKETAFSDLSMNTNVSACGDYVSFGSDYYAIHYNQNFPKRLLVVNWGGHEPAGSIEKAETGEPIKFWMSTAKFF